MVTTTFTLQRVLFLIDCKGLTMQNKGKQRLLGSFHILHPRQIETAHVSYIQTEVGIELACTVLYVIIVYNVDFGYRVVTCVILV